MTPDQIAEMVARTKTRAAALNGREMTTQSALPVIQSFEPSTPQPIVPNYDQMEVRAPAASSTTSADQVRSAMSVATAQLPEEGNSGLNINSPCIGRDCGGTVTGRVRSQGSVKCSTCGREYTCYVGIVREAKDTGPEGQKHWRVRYYPAGEGMTQERILEFDFIGMSQPDLRSKDLFVHLEQGGICAIVFNESVEQGWRNEAFDAEPDSAPSCGGCCGATALLLVCLPVAAYILIRAIC